MKIAILQSPKGKNMCMIHAPNKPLNVRNWSKTKKEEKTNTKRVSQAEFEHGDPDFVDERKPKKEEKEKSLMDKIGSIFN